MILTAFIRSAIEIMRGFQRMMIGFKPETLNVPITLFRPETSIPVTPERSNELSLTDKPLPPFLVLIFMHNG